jgi:hypothetical protein
LFVGTVPGSSPESPKTLRFSPEEQNRKTVVASSFHHASFRLSGKPLAEKIVTAYRIHIFADPDTVAMSGQKQAYAAKD